MIRGRFERLAARLKGSLWLVPTLFTLSAIVLAVLTIRVDQEYAEELPENWFLFAAGAEGARGVLSTIAGSIITVTGVVFSITIVALQLASSQYTPRVLRTFAESRPTKVVLGIFIGTFTYSLLVLRSVRSEVDDLERFVPGISVTTAVLLSLASMAALIFFVNHVVRSIRVEALLDRVTQDALARLDALFPDEMGEPPPSPGRMEESVPVHSFAALRAEESGYLQYVEEEALFETACARDLVVSMAQPVGHFVVGGDLLARVWPAESLRGCEAELRSAFRLGSERTLEQDVERGLIELTDIALRALSPSLNDPTTAIACIDRLTQVLQTLGRRRFPATERMDHQGRLRFVAVRRDFEEMVRLPCGQLRRYGASHPSVALRLIHSLERIATGLPPDRVRPLLLEATEVLEEVRRSVGSARDLDQLERAATAAMERMRSATAEWLVPEVPAVR